MNRIPSKLSLNIQITAFFSVFLLATSLWGSCLLEPIESYYTIKDFGSPHFHLKSLELDTQSFVNLIDEVNQKTHDRAFLIEVPNELYSENIEKLRAAHFFHYFDYPEHNASVWCRTNRSGIPLAASHTLGARSLVYYKDNSEYFFLLIKDRYGHKKYEVPGGYVQPDDSDIIETFEQGHFEAADLNYRSPTETGINEVFEETGFDLTKYGYGPEGTKKPLTIALLYTKNTRPERGIHSISDCCLYLSYAVTANQDPLTKQDYEVSDVRWVSYTDIINDRIPSPTGIYSTTDNIKELVQRVVAADKYKETRRQLVAINKELHSHLSANNSDFNAIKQLINEQIKLLELQHGLELRLKQRNFQDSNNQHVTYFTPL